MSNLPCSPAADRNKEPILAQLRALLPEHGAALEIASGTGQHAVWFAGSMAGWVWQPTDADHAMLPVIAQRTATSGLPNVLPPRLLDVTALRWPSFSRAFDLVFCANMLHIAPWDACRGLMAGAARCLAPDGKLITYGPYFEKDVLTSPGNLAFDEDLRRRDSSWGIRDLEDVCAEARRGGLELTQRHPMPANNLLLVFEAA